MIEWLIGENSTVIFSQRYHWGTTFRSGDWRHFHAASWQKAQVCSDFGFNTIGVRGHVAFFLREFILTSRRQPALPAADSAWLSTRFGPSIISQRCTGVSRTWYCACRACLFHSGYSP
jgi:hypothetical protein